MPSPCAPWQASQGGAGVSGAGAVFAVNAHVAAATTIEPAMALAKLRGRDPP